MKSEKEQASRTYALLRYLLICLCCATMSGCLAVRSTNEISIRENSQINVSYAHCMFEKDNLTHLNGRTFSVEVIFDNPPEYIYQDYWIYSPPKYRYPGNIGVDIQSAFKFICMEYGNMRPVESNADLRFVFTINELFDLVTETGVDTSQDLGEGKITRKAIIDSDVSINGYSFEFKRLITDDFRFFKEDDLKSLTQAEGGIITRYENGKLISIIRISTVKTIEGTSEERKHTVFDPETGDKIAETDKQIIVENVDRNKALILVNADPQFRRLVFSMISKALQEAKNVI